MATVTTQAGHKRPVFSESDVRYACARVLQRTGPSQLDESRCLAGVLAAVATESRCPDPSATSQKHQPQASDSTSARDAQPAAADEASAVDSPKLSAVGIENLGSTCFLAAAIQALCGAESALRAILSLGKLGDEAGVAVIGDAWANGLLSLVTDMIGSDQCVRPDKLHQGMVANWVGANGRQEYSPGMQMDPAEFLLQCIDRVSPLQQPLSINLRAHDDADDTFHPSSILLLPLVEGKSVEALLHYEYVCNTEAGAFRIAVLPQVLVVQVLRFKAGDAGGYVKDDGAVRVSDDLRLYDKHRAQIAGYTLRGWVSHHGPDLRQGHYIADSVRRTDEASAWFTFNDADVSAGRVDRSDASLLVYERVQEQASQLMAAEVYEEVKEIQRSREWPSNRMRAGALKLKAKLLEELRPIITAPGLLEKSVRAQLAHDFSEEVAQLAMLDQCALPSPPQPSLVDEHDRDVDGLDMWNDRANWSSPAVRHNRSLVQALIYRIVMCSEDYRSLLRYKLNDWNTTIFVQRPEQSGKTFTCILLAWLGNICYGQAGYILLRSGSAAAEDYYKFEEPVKRLNREIWKHMVGFSFEVSERGILDSIRCADAVFEERLQKDALLATDKSTRKGFMMPFMLHSHHLHTGDKAMTSSASVEIRKNRYPLIYSRLSTPSNIERACLNEIDTLISDYGVDEFGFANITLLVDEYQQSTKEGTRVHEVMHCSLEQFDALKDALIRAIDMPGSATESERKAELERRFLRWQEHAGDEAGERSSRSHLSACLKGQVRISATTVSGQLTFEQFDMREPKALELPVSDEYYGDKTAKNIVDDKKIKFEWSAGPNLSFLEEADLHPGVTLPTRLQRFCLDEYRVELSREGYSHVLLQAISSRNNANMFEWAKFFIDYANVNAPEVPVVAVTAYMYTTAGIYPGGPWLVFSEAAMPIREVIADTADDLFVGTDKRAGRLRPGVYGDKIALTRGDKLGSSIRELMGRSNRILHDCVQIPKHRELYLPKVLRLLHEAVERVGVDKRQFKVITIGNGMLKVGMTPKTDDHKMGVTLGLISATERQISGMSGEELSQGLAGRIAGPRSGDPYWAARGHDEPPRIVTSGSLTARLEAARHIQKGAMRATLAKGPRQSQYDAIEQHDFVGIHSDPTQLAAHFKSTTVQARKRKISSNPDWEDPGTKVVELAIHNSTIGGIGALPSGFMTAEEAVELNEQRLSMYEAVEECARGHPAEGKMPRIGDLIYLAWNTKFPYYPARVVGLQWCNQNNAVPVRYTMEWVTGDDITLILDKEERERAEVHLDLEMNEWQVEKPKATAEAEEMTRQQKATAVHNRLPPL